MKAIKRIQDRIDDWFHAWWKRQPWKDVPALLAFLLGLAFLYVVMFWDPMSVRVRYGGYMNNALARSDFQTALVASHRLLGLGPSRRNEAIFGMAIAQQGLGQKARAVALMQQVAPSNRPVFAPAHMYVAKALLRQVGTTPELLPVIIAQLNQVLALEPESIEANEILGSIYTSKKEWELAEKRYSAIINKKPEYMLALASIARRQNKEKAAQNWTGDAIIHFQQNIGNASSDNPKNRILYLRALMMRNEFDKAKTVLDEGRKLSGDEPYKPVVAAVCAGLARQIATDHPDNLDARIRLIREGMDSAPKDAALLGLLLGLSEQDGVESQAAGDRVLKMLSKKTIWPPLFFVGAKISSARHDTAGMKTYLGKACQAFPQALPMAADLSATMGADRSADLAFALEMINCVLEQAGDQPLYRLNRGIVLLHSSRARDALADMQFAVDHLENKSPAYRAIAEAYMALGMKNLAQEQLRLSAEAAKAEASQASKPTNDGGTGEKPANKK